MTVRAVSSLLLACILAIMAPGCLALVGGRAEIHELRSVEQATNRLVRLNEGPLRRQLSVEQRGPLVQVQLADQHTCLREITLRRTRTAVTTVRYPPLVRAAMAAEAVAGLLGLLTVTTNHGGATADATGTVLAAFGVGLGVNALADWLAVAGVWNRPEPPRALPDLVEAASPRLEACGIDLPQGATVQAHSASYRAQTWTDANGRAQFDVRRWPAGQFPYGAPLASLHCAGCDPVDVYLDATTGVALVRARNDPDDFAAWLDIHRTAPDAPAVRLLRDRLLRAIADQQDDALRQARRAVDDGDLVLAARLARGCVQVARVPAPPCERLLAQIDDRFVQQQMALGDAAIARGAWQAARDAHYRCRLVDRERPACAQLGHRLAMAQLRAQRQAFEASLVRNDVAAATRALQGILQFASDTPLAVDAQARLDSLQRTLAQRTVDDLARRAERWIRKRKWARALVVLQACQSVGLADTRACAAQVVRLPKGFAGP